MTKINSLTILCLHQKFLEAIKNSNYDIFNALCEDFKKLEVDLVNGFPLQGYIAELVEETPLHYAITTSMDNIISKYQRLRMIEDLITKYKVDLNKPINGSSILFVLAKATEQFSLEEIKSLCTKMIEHNAKISNAEVEYLKSYYAGHEPINLIDRHGRLESAYLESDRIFTDEQIKSLTGILENGLKPSHAAIIIAQSPIYQSEQKENANKNIGTPSIRKTQ